jgi:tRNA1Val (adenine37-N6)-methyltransferase
MKSSGSEIAGGSGEDETLDIWAPADLRIIQKKDGYRFALDSLLLSDFTRLKPKDRVLELGTGCGIISLGLFRKYPGIHLIGLELQAGFVDLARRNLALNQAEGRISLVRGDIRSLPQLFRPGSFDAVVTNPPYRPLHTGRINPQSEKALSRHELAVNLEHLLAATRQALKKGGRFFLIYPVRRLPALLALSRQNHLEPKRLRLVQPLADREADWVLMEAVKEGGEELKVLPVLVVYEKPGVYSPEVRDLLGR